MPRFNMRVLMLEVVLLAAAFGSVRHIEASDVPFFPFAVAMIAGGMAIGALFSKMRQGGLAAMFSSPAAWIVCYPIFFQRGC